MKPEKIKSQPQGQTAATPADVMLNKKGLAPKLNVSLRTVENWQHEGHLPFIRIGNVVLFYWPTVLAHLQTHFSVKPRGVVSPARAGLGTSACLTGQHGRKS